MLKVENRFPWVSHRYFQSKMSFFCALATDRLNRWQLTLFVAIQCFIVYLWATKQCSAINCHPWQTAPTHRLNVPELPDACSLAGPTIRYTSAQVHLVIVCHCLVIVTFELAIVQKNDVEQDVLCAINGTPKLFCCLCCCCCVFCSLFFHYIRCFFC